MNLIHSTIMRDPATGEITHDAATKKAAIKYFLSRASILDGREQEQLLSMLGLTLADVDDFEVESAEKALDAQYPIHCGNAC